MNTRLSSRIGLFASLLMAALVYPTIASDPSDPFDPAI